MAQWRAVKFCKYLPSAIIKTCCTENFELVHRVNVKGFSDILLFLFFDMFVTVNPKGFNMF